MKNSINEKQSQKCLFLFDNLEKGELFLEIDNFDCVKEQVNQNHKK